MSAAYSDRLHPLQPILAIDAAIRVALRGHEDRRWRHVEIATLLGVSANEWRVLRQPTTRPNMRTIYKLLDYAAMSEIDIELRVTSSKTEAIARLRQSFTPDRPSKIKAQLDEIESIMRAEGTPLMAMEIAGWSTMSVDIVRTRLRALKREKRVTASASRRTLTWRII